MPQPMGIASIKDAPIRFVVIGLERIALLVPQSEIVALEPTLDVHAMADDSRSDAHGTRASRPAAQLTINNEGCSVYALDANLRCARTIPAEHRICAILHTPGNAERFALSCVAVQLLDRGAIAFHDIPNPLANPRSPARGLAVYERRLLLVTGAAALHAYLAAPAAAEVIQLEPRLRSARS
jgi:hypothetical protein